jgi:CIC family chloride channel protein
VGREGPGIHLGAASSSLLGQWLRLPNNSIQTLVACGSAAAIAASFNTPIAGVVFSMEVIMLEYTIAGFTPVILAAVSATALTRFVFGSAPAFAVPALQLASLLELPYMLAMGLSIGALAALFISGMKWLTAMSGKLSIMVRMSLAGLFTGLCAMAVPQIMGIGYDTVNLAMLGELSLGLLLAVVLFKLAATVVGLGLGLPGGLIGPTLVIGAAAGGVLGYVAEAVFPGDVASPGFYAMLGMAAMMGATLQAPLAALLALLELTLNPNIILPGMLAVIASGMTTSHVFGHSSVFLTLLRARNLDYRSSPVAQSLRRIGVSSVVNRSFVSSGPKLSVAEANAILSHRPLWILVHEEESPTLLLAADLARYLETATEVGEEGEEQDIDLLQIPAQRFDLAEIREQATLQEAFDMMTKQGVKALYVTAAAAQDNNKIVGIITRQTIEAHYHN